MLGRIDKHGAPTCELSSANIEGLILLRRMMGRAEACLSTLLKIQGSYTDILEVQPGKGLGPSIGSMNHPPSLTRVLQLHAFAQIRGLSNTPSF